MAPEILLAAGLLLVPVFHRLIARRWQPIFYFIMIFMVFEGAFRKWIFPSAQGYIYWFKDMVLLAMYAMFVLMRKAPGPHEFLLQPLRLGLLLSGLYFGLEIVNPLIPSPLAGLIGFKSYMLYPLLLFIVPYAFDSASDLDRKISRYMLIMIPVALLGLVQFALPADHLLNTYVKHDAVADVSVAGFGDNNRVRTTGTFSYLGGFTVFLTAMFNLALACAIAGKPRWQDNFVTYAMLVASTAAIFTTGSRSALVTSIGTAPLVILVCMGAGLISAGAVGRLFLALTAVGVALIYLSGEAMDAFYHRATTSDSWEERVLSPFTQVLAILDTAPIFGIGIGATHNSIGTIMGVSDMTNMWWLLGHSVEDETARVMLEVGLPGFFLVYAVRIGVALWALRFVSILRQPRHRALCAAIAVFLLGQVLSQIINNPTAGLFFWIAAGLPFAMYRIEQLELRTDTGRWVRSMVPHSHRQFTARAKTWRS